jgi:hypothetical protein
MPKCRLARVLLLVAMLATRAVAQSPAEEELVDPWSPAIELMEPEFELILDPQGMVSSQWDDQFEIVPEQPFDWEELPLPDNAAKIAAGAPKPPRKWEGRIEFGMNGSEGNSDRFATRYGGKVKRTTEANQLTLDLLYSVSYAKGVLNEDKLLSDARSEWPLFGSPWFVYSHGVTEYDRFTAYDVRLTSDSGIGYQYINTGMTQFRSRLGAGFNQEINSPDERFTPEGIIGFTFEHKLSRRQKLIASGDMFHDLRDLQDFRSRSNASWEIKIDPPARLSVRFGIINRYDSTPNGKRRNDLDYSSVVVWEF